MLRLVRLCRGGVASNADFAEPAVKAGGGPADSPGAMPSRPTSSSTKRITAAELRSRCERLEALLRRTLGSRRDARVELQQARARLRTAGDDFVVAFEAIDARTDAAVSAAELRGLLGHDLDVDTTLTVATEHLLARFRPSNVAIWLCNGRGDHAVAAYGANDVPRARAEASLGVIGRETCPLLGAEPVALVFESALDMVTVPPPGGGVLPGHRALIVPMAHRGERYGAILLLQNESAPWQPNAGDVAAAIGAVLGEQIDRITRIVVQRSAHWPGGAPEGD
jgi:hypothetical protein